MTDLHRAIVGLIGVYEEGTVELSGGTNALRELIISIRDTSIQRVNLTLPESTSPYDGALACQIITRSDQNIRISRDGKTLKIVGAQEKLCILADNIEFLAGPESTSGDHLHIEWVPQHFYLQENSFPLIISRL